MNTSWQNRILHLGLGNFHRAHQAVYFQRLAELADFRWGVTAVTLGSSEAREQLRSCQLKYPVVELSEKNLGVIWVESIRQALDGQEDLPQVLDTFCQSELEIITLTIGEKGYCLNAQGELDLKHPDIRQDLENPTSPQTALGLLALGIKARMQAGESELTVLSCDSLNSNGFKLRAALLLYLSAVGWREVVDWVKRHVAFPNTVVDRMVPSLTSDKTQEMENRFGLKANSQVVVTEEYTQWVIEDNFKRGLPEWGSVGVQFVAEVKPYQEIQLRMLDAAHSFLAYSGLLRGHQYLHEAIVDPALHPLVELLILREVMPLLDLPVSFNVLSYEENLMSRFRNDQLPQQLRQIAMNGSLKLPLQVLPSLIQAHQMNSSKEVLVTTVCAWLNYCWKILGYNSQLLEDPQWAELISLDRTDRFSFFRQVLQTPTFAPLQGMENLQQLILKKASTYSLLV